MQMQTPIEVSRKQLEYIKNATKRYNAKLGARQCGKTYVDISQIIPERILERAGLKGLNFILGVTKETIERNVLEPMRDFWEPILGNGCVTSINSRNVATLFGEKVYCLGAEKASQVSKMRGAKIKYLYIDEIVDIHYEVFKLVQAGLSLDYSICDFTGNPAHPLHWVKELIDSDINIYSQKWTIYDNPFLSPTVVENFEKEYKGTHFYNRYILGEWAAASGNVYPMFDELIHTVTPTQRNYEKIFVCVDYGTQNSTAFIVVGLHQGKYYVIDEYYHSGRETNQQKTTSEYYEELDRLIDGRNVEPIVVDPAATHFIAEIRKHGEYMVRNAVNDVLPGIDAVSKMLKNEMLYVNKNCKNLIREFGLYQWNQKTIEDVPIKIHDHGLDALRYGVMTFGWVRGPTKFIGA